MQGNIFELRYPELRYPELRYTLFLCRDLLFHKITHALLNSFVLISFVYLYTFQLFQITLIPGLFVTILTNYFSNLLLYFMNTFLKGILASCSPACK